MSILSVPEISRKKKYSWIILLAGIAFIFIVRFYVDGAAVRALRWLLGPVAALTELQTGEHFVFDETRGYVNSSGNIILSLSCAGYNFISIAWLTGFSFLWMRLSSDAQRVLAFFLAGIAAFALGVLVNSFRINISMNMVALSNELLHKNRTHEAVGSFIYLSFLVMYFFLLNHLFKPAPYEKPA